jgi:hypothetical protein
MENKKMNYRVCNLVNKSYWEGDAVNAKEAYSHIKINAGDTTTVHYGKYGFAVKEWKKDNKN